MNSVSPQLLSPRVSTPPDSSPPPKLEAEDYLGAHSRKKLKGKRGRKGRKHYEKRNASDETHSSQKLLSSGPPTLASRSSYRTSHGSIQQEESSPSPSEGPLQKSATFPRLGSYGDAQQPTVLRIHTLMNATLEQTPTKTHSLALESLKRYDPQESHNGDGRLRRLSESIATTLGKYRPKDLGTTPRHAVDDHPRRTSFGQTNPNRATLMSEGNIPYGANKPASITLRKPSKAVTSPSSHAPGRMTDLPLAMSPVDSKAFSELVAFRSTVLGSEIAGYEEDLPAQTGLSTRASTISFGNSDRATPKGLVDFGKSPNGKRSPPASTVLTFTDTHVAPGTFTVDTRSRRASVASGFQSRRLSVVQLFSRDSIHEVIWREGESTSDSSSPNQTSAFRGGTESSPASASCNKDSLCDGDFHVHQVPRSQSDLPKDPSSGQFDQQMLNWTWDNNDTLLKPTNEDHSTSSCKAHSGSNNATASCDNSMSQHDSERHPSSDIRSAAARYTQRQNFQSNSKGSSTQSQRSKNAKEDEISEESTSLANGPPKRRLSSHPFATARTGESGGTGSSIGRSSHQKLAKS